LRDGYVEVRVRDIADLPRAMSLAGTPGSAGQSSGGAVDVRDMGEGLMKLTPAEPAFNERLRASLDRTAEIIKQRLAGLAIETPGAQRDGMDRILVLLPGVKNPSFMAMLSSRAHLTFQLIDLSISPEEALQKGVPGESEVLYGFKSKVPHLVKKQAVMDGRDMADAAPGFDQRTNEPIVTFRFGARGTREFARVTQENVGQPLAIVFDNAVIAAPIIREPILGGTGQLSGGFSLNDANDLAILLRAGTLPVSLSLVEQQVVEPAQKN
jgi:preprotein translocase subunit SecD